MTVLILGLQSGQVQGFELFGRTFFESETDTRVEVLNPRNYRVAFRVTGGDSDLTPRLKAASGLWQNRNEPAAGPAGLIGMAQGDYANLLSALYHAGYYGPVIDIRIGNREVTGLTFFDDFPDGVEVSVQVDAGPQFRFGPPAVTNPAPLPPKTGLRAGEPAFAGAIEDYVHDTIDAWRDFGFARADLAGQSILADHPAARLDVTLAFNPGPKTFFGLVTTEGSHAIDPDFIRYMADIGPGEVFSPQTLEDARRRLNRLDVFSSVRLVEADELTDGDRLPIDILVQDRAPRTFAIGAVISSIDGLAIDGFWLHRNLFGRAESLRVEASVGQIGSSLNPQEFDYRLAAIMTRPGTFTPETDLVGSLELERLYLPGYSEQGLTAGIGLQHTINQDWTGSLFLQYEKSKFDVDGDISRFSLLSLQGTGVFDRRDDILDPTRGYYVELGLAPYYDLERSYAGLTASAEGRLYFALDENAANVIAGRLMVGSVLGAQYGQVPPDRLYFIGGGGSVRGYAFESIGWDRQGGDPVGGLSVVEGSLELRHRFSDRIGLAGFVDAGEVGRNSLPGEPSQFAAGIGVGGRYITALGPLRADLAFPLDQGLATRRFAIYIGIGQAF